MPVSIESMSLDTKSFCRSIRALRCAEERGRPRHLRERVVDAFDEILEVGEISRQIRQRADVEGRNRVCCHRWLPCASDRGCRHRRRRCRKAAFPRFRRRRRDRADCDRACAVARERGRRSCGSRDRWRLWRASSDPRTRPQSAVFASCVCSAEISLCIFTRSRPGARAATSFRLISLTVSMALFIAVTATSAVAAPRPSASWTVETAMLSDFIVVAIDQ